MVEEHFSVYHHRAQQLAGAMRLCQDDLHAYASAAALLAVHSAISFGDALVLSLGGSRSKSESHEKAVAVLKRACAGAKVDLQGVNHFQKLLSAKTDISYGNRTIEDEKAAALCIAADRFQAWVERTLEKRKGRLSRWP